MTLNGEWLCEMLNLRFPCSHDLPNDLNWFERSHRVSAVAATAAAATVRTGNTTDWYGCSSCSPFAAAIQSQQWKHFALHANPIHKIKMRTSEHHTCTVVVNIQHYLGASSSAHYRACVRARTFLFHLCFTSISDFYVCDFVCVAGFVDVFDLLVQLCAHIKVLPAKHNLSRRVCFLLFIFG